MKQLFYLTTLFAITGLCGCSGGVSVPTEFEYIGSIDKFVWMEAPVGWDNEVLDKRNLSIETKTDPPIIFPKVAKDWNLR